MKNPEEIRDRMARVVAPLTHVDSIMGEAIDLELLIDTIDHENEWILRDIEKLESLTEEYRTAREEYLSCTDPDLRIKLGRTVEHRIDYLDIWEIRDWMRQLHYDIEHQVIPSRTQLPIYEITDDNGVGIEVPEGDGHKSVNYGWSSADVIDLIGWATSYSVEEFKSIMDEVDGTH